MNANSYKIDFINNTMTITKAFERAANYVGSEEYEMMRKIMVDFPNMKIVRKPSAARRDNRPNRGLTYEAMECYIRENGSADLLNEFEEIRYIAKRPYHYMKKWFVERFPEWASGGLNRFNATEIEMCKMKAA